MAITNCSLVGVSLAQRLHAPNLAVAQQVKGQKGWVWLSNLRFPFAPNQPPADSTELPFYTEEIFYLQQAGKLNVLMGPAQLDRTGNMNISAIGDWKKPAAVLALARGVPDNTTNGKRVFYVVNNHSKRVFVEEVDFVCGYGWGPLRREGTIRYGGPEKVFTNLGIMGFEQSIGRIRLESVHTGISVEQVVENTGFELVMPDPVPETAAPTDEELRLIREVIDPLGMRRLDFLKGDAYKEAMKEISAGITH